MAIPAALFYTSGKNAITARAVSADGATLLGPITLTANGAVATLYQGSFSTADPSIGWSICYYDNGVPIPAGVENYTPDETLLNSVYQKVSLIGATGITLRSPFLEDGDLQIIQGDDYTAALGNGLSWSDDGSWPDLSQSGTSIAFYLSLKNRDGSIQSPAAIIVAGSVAIMDDEQVVSVDLSGTIELAVGYENYRFSLRASFSSGSKRTLALGDATILVDAGVPS